MFPETSLNLEMTTFVPPNFATSSLSSDVLVRSYHLAKRGQLPLLSAAGDSSAAASLLAFVDL